jgi:CheY-like chemotaxis protein
VALPAAPVPAAAQRTRILVAEDNADLLEMACSLFEALGQDVRGAAGVDEALARLDEGAYDILFTDIDLAGESGVELARRARAQDPRLAVVFASGYGAPDRQAAGFAFDVVAKPYRLDDLRAMLARLA